MKAVPTLASAHPFKINCRYDPAKDITTTLLSPGKQIVTDTGDNKLYVIASFAYKGETPARPRRVFLGFSSLYGLNDLERADITLILEGSEQFDLTGKVVNTQAQGIPLALLGLYIPSEDFIRLAQSAHIEVRLQNIRSILSQEQLAGLRDLASRIPAEESEPEAPSESQTEP